MTLLDLRRCAGVLSATFVLAACNLVDVEKDPDARSEADPSEIARSWGAPSEASPSEAGASAADAGHWVAVDLARGAAADAREWLRTPGNRLLEGRTEDVQLLVDNLYRDGATQIWFTGIEQFGESFLSASLAVELPEDPGNRLALLRREAEFWVDKTPSPDVGQRYLYFSF